jgi:PBP1b-binding outer membrane lipoprotein LpoB
MTKKIIYSSLLAIALLSGCSEDDTDTGGSNDTTTEQTETNHESSSEVSTTPGTVEQTQLSTTNTTIQPVEVSNQAPIVNAGEDKTVTVNETIIITGSATDDGTISDIEWKKSNEVLATTLSFEYTPTEVGTDVLTLTVVDDDGDSASDSVSIKVEEESGGKSDVFGKIK